jgi:hypothetical protein
VPLAGQSKRSVAGVELRVDINQADALSLEAPDRRAGGEADLAIGRRTVLSRRRRSSNVRGIERRALAPPHVTLGDKEKRKK